jgi:putative ABC transport system permease protein
VAGFRITANLFETLGTQPMLGRAFTTAEEMPGNHHRVILSHSLWQRRFAGDGGILGRTVLIDAVPHEVVGEGPAGFNFPLGADAWAPLALTAAQARAAISRR